MTDAEIQAALRDFTPRSAVSVAERLSELLGRPLTHGAMIRYFAKTFPFIPFGVLLQAAQWYRFAGEAGLTDEEFNALFAPWFGGEG